VAAAVDEHSQRVAHELVGRVCDERAFRSGFLGARLNGLVWQGVRSELVVFEDPSPV
jgi:hypothetical protein